MIELSKKTVERRVFVFPRLHVRHLVVVTTLFLFSVPYIFLHMTTNYFHTGKPHYDDLKKDWGKNYTIQTEGCTIPALQVLDDSIKRFVVYPRNFGLCRNASLALLGNNQTHIWVNKNNKEYYNITVKNSDYFYCCYQSFSRPNIIKDITSSVLDHRVLYSKYCRFFTDVLEAKDELVRVICRKEKLKVYTQFYIFAVKKKFLTHENEIPVNSSGYNVLILGIDGVSRLNFHRTMPKTLDYLIKNGAVELLGYNKVGDNTFPNLIPMLLGVKETELINTCIPYKSATFDNCPFIWNIFKKAGYYTAFGEDTSYIGTFNYFKPGFVKTPTDYYFHTFIHEANKYIGFNKAMNAELCLNEKWTYKYFLDYINNLSMVLNENRLFGFFWEITMSHDFNNYPMLMDSEYLNFLNKLHNTSYLNETVLFMVSDHGMRWGNIRSTIQGRIEENLPFVYILLPNSFKETYRNALANLKINSKRLTTPFDMHETLMDLANLNTIENKAITSRSSEMYAHNRGISLFLPVPENRTCELADIADHWCTCHKEIELPVNFTAAQEGVKDLIGHINNMIKNYPLCAQLDVKRTLKVMGAIMGKADNSKNSWTELVVTIQASPGDGVFEGTLRNNGRRWSVSGAVSRINLYGTQSHCMPEAELKLYCYCQNLL